jgi:hypothetical protein
MKPFLVLFAVAVVLTGCTAIGLPPSRLAGSPGFWLGVWHGMIFPITVFVSMFNPAVGVYAAVNDGLWYNLGYFGGIALSMGGGAGASAMGRRKKNW